MVRTAQMTPWQWTRKRREKMDMMTRKHTVLGITAVMVMVMAVDTAVATATVTLLVMAVAIAMVMAAAMVMAMVMAIVMDMAAAMAVVTVMDMAVVTVMDMAVVTGAVMTVAMVVTGMVTAKGMVMDMPMSTRLRKIGSRRNSISATSHTSVDGLSTPAGCSISYKVFLLM